MEKKLQPKLRFKEFSGEWKRSTLEKVVKINMGQSPDSKSYNDDKIGLPLIQGNADLQNRISVPRNYTSSPTKTCDKGDILMTVRAPVGSIAKSLHHACIGRGVCSIKSSNDFIYQFLLDFEEKWDKFSQGSTFTAVNSSDIKGLKINIPPLPEQEKIALFLSSVDSKIEKLEKKRELLSDYKKGMMQKIFSQEIRFKKVDGTEYPVWEEKKLGEIGVFNSTNSFSRSLLNYEDGSVYNIHYGDIYTKFSTHLDLNKFDLPYVNNDVSLDKIKDESYCQDGDVVIADASESYEDIGSAIEISNIGEKRVLAGLHTFLLRPHKDMIAKGYMEQYLQCSKIRKEIKKIATGISVLGISKGNLSKIILNLPCLEEQEKISNFLSSIDKKIEIMEKEIEGNKEFKRGLLQQMFI